MTARLISCSRLLVCKQQVGQSISTAGCPKREHANASHYPKPVQRPARRGAKRHTVIVRVPVGVVPRGDVMVPATVTGALAAGLVGVTVWVMDVAPRPPPPGVTVMGVGAELPGLRELPGAGAKLDVTVYGPAVPGVGITLLKALPLTENAEVVLPLALATYIVPFTLQVACSRDLNIACGMLKPCHVDGHRDTIISCYHGRQAC